MESQNVQLCDGWEPGDRVFVFGFSRGAYSARVLSGMLHTLGLLRGNQNLVPYVEYGIGAMRDEREDGTQTSTADDLSWTDLCAAFQHSLARVIPMIRGRTPVPGIHYLGVWDTVASISWAWDPVQYPFTARNPSVKRVRHALAIDERRWFFRENRMYQAAGQQLEQRWFPGVHCDVGGGYRLKDGGLWRGPLEWLLEGARDTGLLMDAQRKATIAPPPPLDTALQPTRIADRRLVAGRVRPKQRWNSERKRRQWAIGAGRFERFARATSSIPAHCSASATTPTYRPKTSMRASSSTVRGLPEWPGPITIRWHGRDVDTAAAPAIPARGYHRPRQPQSGAESCGLRHPCPFEARLEWGRQPASRSVVPGDPRTGIRPDFRA
ncbi:MAG: DUF2235 domain-containing protein [Vicinamibacterales bacterium]